MKFRIKKQKFSKERKVGVSKGFTFTYCFIDGFFVVVSHNKKDIRFNTIWENIVFQSEIEVVEWCENFDYTKHECLGTLN